MSGVMFLPVPMEKVIPIASQFGQFRRHLRKCGSVYVVEIALPEGLRTNYGKLLPASRELKGTADIILADRNVLERLLASLRKVVEYEE